MAEGTALTRQIEIIPKSHVLTRGQPVAVLIRVYFDEPTKIRGIKARFHGAERTEADYTTTTTDSKGRTTTTTHTAVEFVDIVDRFFTLHGDPADGFLEGLGDSFASLLGGGVSELIDAGHHEFEIDVAVPIDSPPSFEGEKCSVFYRLEVQIDVPIWPDPKQDYGFAVLTVERPPEKIEPVLVSFPDPERGRGFWDKAFGKNIKLDVALDRDVLRGGEEVRGMVSIKTEEELKLNRIALSLVGIEESEARGYRDSHGHVIPVGSIETPAIIASEYNQEFDFQPTNNGPFSVTGTNFRISWVFEVRLDVPWAKDSVIHIPVEYTTG